MIEEFRLSVTGDDGDVEFFDIEHVRYFDENWENPEEYFFVKHRGDIISENLEFTDTLDDCIKGCIYYFHTRF